MPKEKNEVELSDEALKKVTGGAPGDLDQPCEGWTEDKDRFKAIGATVRHCGNCTHYIRPEGPCELNYTCF